MLRPRAESLMLFLWQDQVPFCPSRQNNVQSTFQLVTDCIFGTKSKRARAGSSTRAPTMFQTNINANNQPISACNCMRETPQVSTSTPGGTQAKTTTLPMTNSAH